MRISEAELGISPECGELWKVDYYILKREAFMVKYNKEWEHIYFDKHSSHDTCWGIATGHDGECWNQECLELFIDPVGDRQVYYHFAWNPVDSSSYEASNSQELSRLDPLYGKEDKSWNCKWEYLNDFDKSKNIWYSVVKIPFAAFESKPPQAGTIWNANFAREHHTGHREVEFQIWSPNFESSSFHNREILGELKFK